jgi:hypothetical protein
VAVTRATTFLLSVATCLIFGVPAVATAGPSRFQVDCAAVTIPFPTKNGNACFAVDRDEQTAWRPTVSKGKWLLLDLRQVNAVYKIRLKTRQSGEGTLSVTINAGSDPGNLATAYTWTGSSTDNQWLEFTGDGDSYDGGEVRYIKVTVDKASAWEGWREIEVYRAVEYFGYFHDTNPVRNDMAEAKAAGANLTHVFTQDVKDLEGRLKDAKALGLTVMVDLADLIFSWKNGDQTTLDRDLVDSIWIPQWKQIVSLIRNGYEDTVAAFYLFDEPYLHGLEPDDLAKFATVVHQDFPAIATAAVMEVAALDRLGRAGINMTTPTGRSALDWVGFDCYGPFDSCASHYSKTLRQWINADQRLIAVPQAFRKYLPPDAEPALSSMQLGMIGDNINKWQREILSDAKYVLILPFRWGPAEEPDGSIEGTRTMPFVRQRIYELAYSSLAEPASRAFPISVGASSRYQPATDPEQHAAFGAFDLEMSSMWNSGCYPVGPCDAPLGDIPCAKPCVYAKFAGITRLTEIRLTPSQDRRGPVRHIVSGCDNKGTCVELATFTRLPVGKAQFVWKGKADVSEVRVATLLDSSWVAWKEIEFFSR